MRTRSRTRSPERRRPLQPACLAWLQTTTAACLAAIIPAACIGEALARGPAGHQWIAGSPWTTAALAVVGVALAAAVYADCRRADGDTWRTLWPLAFIAGSAAVAASFTDIGGVAALWLPFLISAAAVRTIADSLARKHGRLAIAWGASWIALVATVSLSVVGALGAQPPEWGSLAGDVLISGTIAALAAGPAASLGAYVARRERTGGTRGGQAIRW